MQWTLLPIVLLSCSFAFQSPALALEQAVCDQRLEPINERIDSGNYPAQNVQIATQVRDSLIQSCAFLDEASLEKMMEGFEQLLPTQSDSERQDSEKARRVERSAQREVQRAELEAKRARKAEIERNKVVVDRAPVSEILLQPPGASALPTRVVERLDSNTLLSIKDWDTYRGKARILYTTSPDNQQFVADQPQNHIYVVEVTSKGELSQAQVTNGPVFGIEVVALRRGYDEILLQQSNRGTGKIMSLERWSISDGSLISSADAPAVPWSSGRPFSMVTTDGNVGYIGGRKPARGNSSALWLIASPAGSVLGQGELTSEISDITVLDWFASSGGGIGLRTLEIATSDAGLDSGFEPVAFQFGNDELTAVSGTEQYFLATDATAEIVWKSSVIERSLIWQGLAAFGANATMAQQQELQQIMSDAVRDYDGTVNFVKGSFVSFNDGYGVLMGNNYRNKEQISVYGTWLYEYAADGSTRKTYLNPDEEHLGARFKLIAAPEPGSIYLFADPYVVRLDENREVNEFAKLQSKRHDTKMLADPDGVWLFGGRTAQKGGVWVQRVEF